MEREVNKAREKSIKAMEKKKRERERDSESSWIVEERERERGGCHPWLPLITHSLMTLFFFLLPLLFRGRGGGREFGRRPIKQGHTEFTTSRWDCPPPGKCLRMCVVCSWCVSSGPGDSLARTF